MLQEYIEELISKYPPNLIESILADIQDDKDFYKALSDLNITTDFDFDEDFDSSDDSDDSDDEDIQLTRRSMTGSKFGDE